MPTVYFGKKNEAGLKLEESNDLIVIRTRSGRPLTRSTGSVPSPVAAELDDATEVVEYPEAGVTVYRVPVAKNERSLDERKARLRSAPDVRFAGGVLVDPKTRESILYTENVFLKFADSADSEKCEQVIRDAGLKIKEKVGYATNGYFLEAAEGTGQAIFRMAEKLLDRKDVEYCHPELVRARARKGIFPQQWHLKKTVINGAEINAHANVEAAHNITRGEGVVIAIIDDGVDIGHVEFGATGKVVAPRDATLQTADPRPKDAFGTGPEEGDNHGTACAGVACAGGLTGASGVAPNARLMPIRLVSGLGSQREADAFVWAADHGADVISCSWGPVDGRWWLASDPKHHEMVQLPASTQLALDYVTSRGRGGKGCVVLFAAGNGNESVDNDGYASYSKVTAVAACNDHGTRSVYSDFGAAVWCSFPSNDFVHAPFEHAAPSTPGIWTTDRSGPAGYNIGLPASGDAHGDFANNFGGTSSACPGVAGVVALILSVNPDLKWNEVKDLLKRACDRIDPQGGAYDSSGHSDKYGYGRINALSAVELARPASRSVLSVTRQFDALIPDLQTVRFAIDVADNTPVEGVVVELNLKHTFIGDLLVTLEPPPATAVAAVTLHQRAGGGAKDLMRKYDTASTPALSKLGGKRCNGRWMLQITDAAAGDSGTLISVALHFKFTHPDRMVRQPSAARPVPAQIKRRPIKARSRSRVRA